MNATTGVWETLDLKRTADVGAIRRAYATRLKQTDVEADPEAFIRLRQALQAALAYAAAESSGSPPPDPPERPDLPPNDLTAPVLAAADSEGLVTVEAPKAEAGERRLAVDAGASASREAPPPSDERVASALSPPRLEREAVGTIAAFSGGAPVSEGRVRQERFNRLQSLLFSEEAPPSAEIGDLASEILADPYMANLKYAAEVEAWMADIICAASPRSDPIIERAVPHFRWDADFGKLDQPPKVTAIVERWRGLLFLHHISQPGHEYHTAWRELARRDEGPAWNKWFIGGKVRHLLAVIRDRYPAAETGLNPYRVGMWEPDVGPQDYEWFGMWGALMFFLFPPGAMAVAWFNHNPTWFRIAVSLWAAFWIVATLTRG